MHNYIEKLASIEHANKTKQHICIEKTKVTATVEHYAKRCIWEAVEIKKCNNKQK
jgi:hypothetical protein